MEKLKDDESGYVRRSVANSLNDISKDHTELVSEIAEQWFKQGHRKTLQVLGYDKPRIASCDLLLHAA